MRTIALMPMKSHSQRVPNKNFREIAGKPLYRWMLDMLVSIESIDKVVINTDADELLDNEALASSDRVLVRRRKPELRGDEISMNRVLADDIDAIAADLYLMTHTTNPLLTASTIERAIQDLAASPASDSLFSVNRYQTRFYRADGSAVNHDPQNLIPTQDLEPWFEENSNLYLFSRDSFQTTNARIGANPLMFTTPKTESMDIDDLDDWSIAEAMLLYRERQR